MARRRSLIGLCSVAALLALSPALAPAQPTADEFVCELKANLYAWRYAERRARCVMSCQRAARGGTEDPANCVPPFAGETQGCVNGANGKAQGTICNACADDAPECYPDANCPALADGKMALTAAQIDPIVAAAYCDDSGSGDGLTPFEAKCQDVVAKYVSKFITQKVKCLARCRKGEAGGKVPPGSCDAGAVTDQRTIDCVAKVELRARTRIDRGCLSGTEQPECFGSQTAAGWVALGEQAVDDEDAGFYCE